MVTEYFWLGARKMRATAAFVTWSSLIYLAEITDQYRIRSFLKKDFDRLIFHDPSSSLFFTPLFFTLLLTEIVQFSVLYRNKWNFFFSTFSLHGGMKLIWKKKFRYFLSLLFIVFLSFVH